MSATGSDRVRLWVERLRAHAAALFLVVLVLVQSPRLTASDTKLDLYVDPVGFLGRALSLWDPQAAAGQLQNQAYGYLFPMGPFFALGKLLHLPSWLVQRLWWCLVLLTAYYGVRQLLGRLGVGTSGTRVVAGLAYALSPRLLGALGAVSIEVWPMAVAPWVLIPLLRVPAGRARTAAARSALAVLCVGGVNAVATVAVLPMPLLWLLLRMHRPGGRRLAAWWSVLVAAACLWWVLPLLLLGRYSPPFLDWIESAGVTTSPAALAETLRGTTHWVAGIVSAQGPQWPAAFDVLTTRTAVVAGLVLALLGCVGLTRPGLPHHRFWRWSAAGGLLLLTFGHTGPLTAPWAPAAQDLLDGALAPLRNVHKFDLLLRLPLAAGLAAALAELGRLRSRVPLLPGMVRVVVASCLVVLVAPAALIGVAQRGPVAEVPDWWRQTATYLADTPSSGRTLVLPGASFADSLWGDPRDEPLQPLARSPWLVRDAVPLGSGGATRLLTAVEQAVSTGQGGNRLAGLLRQLGVSRVVLRSDLDWRGTGAPPPLVVRQALATTTDLEPVRTFGPLVGGSARADVALDDGIDQPVATIEVWRLDRAGPARAAWVDVEDVVVQSGGSERSDRPGLTSVLAGDRTSRDQLLAAGGGFAGRATDSLQRRRTGFAAVRDVYGPPLAASESYDDDRRGHDWVPAQVPVDDPSVQTTARWEGVASVEASSSRATPLLGGGRVLAASPLAAVDRNGDTAWVSDGPATGSWWEVVLPEARMLPTRLDVVLDDRLGADVSALEVRTDTGRVTSPVDPGPAELGSGVASGHLVTVAVPPGATRSLRLRVVSVRNEPFRPVAVVDVGPGVLPVAVRRLVVPATGARTGEISLRATADRRDACVRDGGGVARCQPSRSRQGEEQLRLDRRVTVEGAGRRWSVTGTARARYGTALNRLLDAGASGPVVRSSSTWVDDALLRPGVVSDGDPRTYWAPATDDEAPTLTLRYAEPQAVRTLRLDTDAEVVGARPLAVRVRVGGRSVDREVEVDGTVTVPAMRGRTVSVTVLRWTRSVSLRSGLGQQPLPVVIGELTVDGASAPTRSDATAVTGVPCGFGPTLVVDGRSVPTRVTGTRDEIASGAAVPLEACDDVFAFAATHDVTALASAEFSVDSLELRRVDDATGAATASAPSAPAAADVESWTATERAVRVEAAAVPRLLVVAENANDGWQARLGDERLASVVLDGWKQGYVVPPGTSGTLRLVFAPQRPYVAALLLGGATALVVLLLVALPLLRRRRSGSALERGVDGPSVPDDGRAPGPWPLRALDELVPAALCLAVAGPVGLLAWAAVRAGLVVLRRPAARSVLIAVAGAVLVVVSAWRPWPLADASNRGWLAQLVAVVVIAFTLAPPARGPARGGSHGAPGRGGGAPAGTS